VTEALINLGRNAATSSAEVMSEALRVWLRDPKKRFVLEKYLVDYATNMIIIKGLNFRQLKFDKVTGHL
jgi:endonuclease/exonuclease/phosphatase (EEP) superfamily protein YafD